MQENTVILIIEDNIDDREYITRNLSRAKDAHYRCIEVGSGEQGIALLPQHRIDCVLLDYSLPGKDGLKILRAIREHNRYLPVIMLTRQGSESVAVEAIKLGAQNYLSKTSCTTEVLQRAIDSAIEHVSMERRLGEQRRLLEEQAEELEIINEELETFTYIASHDLRSPLVSLRGFSGELYRSIDIIIPMLEKILPLLGEIDRDILQREICQRIPKSLTYINTAAEKMDRMTTAILKLSRLGHIEASLEQIDTRKMVDQCVAALAHQVQKTRTTIDIGEMPDIVGNPTFMEQVFGNILDNALKYMDPKRDGQLKIHGFKEGSMVHFIIQDNGRGIAKGDLHKVFEIFRRAGDTEKIPGEGMGMSYVRAIIRRHGGSIWCDSTLDAGTAFHFTISSQNAERQAA